MAGSETHPGGGADIVVQDLEKVFFHGGRQLMVLHGLNFRVGAGERVAVLGASGVGKSTLLHLLGTLDVPTSGRILFNGRELTRLDPAALARFRNREIGFVFQFHHLLPEFTALENVMMPALIQRVPREHASELARAILARVGLAERLTHRPGELSGGEQQRVALARALIMSPKLLLADEPTGNLDAKTGEGIHALLEELNHERGTTMLVVTHNPELAGRMPRRLHMVEGRLGEDPDARPPGEIERHLA
jgi:lipoprotein-releasing system ATP-binding protein